MTEKLSFFQQTIERGYILKRLERHSPTSIPVIILKDNTDILVRPLTLVLKQSFQQATFSEISKTAEISPIHEKQDTLTIINYRPKSFLSAFSKISENAMYH